MIIWHWTYVKGPLRQRERKPASTTMLATLSDEQKGIFYIHHPTDRIPAVYTMA